MARRRLRVEQSGLLCSACSVEKLGEGVGLLETREDAGVSVRNSSGLRRSSEFNAFPHDEGHGNGVTNKNPMHASVHIAEAKEATAKQRERGSRRERGSSRRVGGASEAVCEGDGSRCDAAVRLEDRVKASREGDWMSRGKEDHGRGGCWATNEQCVSSHAGRESGAWGETQRSIKVAGLRVEGGCLRRL